MRTLLLLPLVACGWSQDRYHEEWTQAFCDQIISCEYGDLFQYEDEDACLADVEAKSATASDSDCQDYDGQSAKECVTEYRALGCDELFDPDKQPKACDTICSNTADTGG